VQNTGSFLTRASILLVLSGALAAACGRSDLDLTPFQEVLPDGGNPLDTSRPDGVTPPHDSGRDIIITPDAGDIFIPPPSCPNGSCDNGETCTTCPQDCGLCASCGDNTCNNGETCSSCPQDCGLCPHCPDGVCDDGETCLSCAPDCGPCPSCGDGKCDTADAENCFTCPEDCGECMTCGNGLCDSGETCASCPTDCGVCSFCGNGKCEMFETCSNCPADCGSCKEENCLATVTCAIGCIMPPSFDLTCLDNCLSGTCANGLNAANNVITCALTNCLLMGGGGGGAGILGCIMDKCPSQLASCEDTSCTEM